MLLPGGTAIRVSLCATCRRWARRERPEWWLCWANSRMEKGHYSQALGKANTCKYTSSSCREDVVYSFLTCNFLKWLSYCLSFPPFPVISLPFPLPPYLCLSLPASFCLSISLSLSLFPPLPKQYCFPTVQSLQRAPIFILKTITTVKLLRTIKSS